MKRNAGLALLSLVFVCAGILLKDISRIVTLVLILLGIASVFVLLYTTARKYANRCPACGFMLYPGIRMLKDKKDGMVRCPRCEILVRVEDIKVISRKQ